MVGITFGKYKTRGAGYHWVQNSMHPTKMNAFVKARYQKCIALLENKMVFFTDKKILDLGCGDGVLTFELYKKGAECYGVDSSEEAIDYAKKKHNWLKSKALFYVESCTKTHFKDAFFDGIISSDVIEHLNEPEMMLSEIHRLLKPGGIAVISTPIKFTKYPSDLMHSFEWFKEDFEILVKSIFSKAVFEYSHPLFWYELIIKGDKYRLGVNIMSYIINPFLNAGRWKYPCMQYSIIEKI